MLASFRIARYTSLLRAARRQSTAATSSLAPVPGLDLSQTKLRRAVFYVPCSEERKIQKSFLSPADCIMYDLEDGVSLNRKGLARSLVISALGAAGPRARELGVRINAIGSGLEKDDLTVVLQAARLDVIMIPKVETPGDIHYVSELVKELAPESNVRIIAGIETARGIVNIRDIAQADRRVDSLLFAAEDYCADTGISRTKGRQELYYARSVVATTAHAYKLQAIDMVTMDFRDMDVLREESREGAEMGFTGKQVIHPNQVDIVQECFAPSKETVARAWRIVDGYQKHYKLGKGAFDLDGKAIDMPVVKWAYHVLHRAEMAGIDATKIGD
ncbi:hypothetical protein H4S07_001961 [Coemansia furcata]|uniref:Uncharacterized protein n=1 Tax=Coemansia furcata TaxID=417177 RepID=A0ACC1LM58_9FUNG|nr:hypothetical protein H4S07_001961 [Coemansia furcata]